MDSEPYFKVYNSVSAGPYIVGGGGGAVAPARKTNFFFLT